METTKTARYALADKITEVLFDIDPYNGMFEDEMTDANRRDLRTLSGCYEIIDGLLEVLKELNESVHDLD